MVCFNYFKAGAAAWKDAMEWYWSVQSNISSTWSTCPSPPYSYWWYLWQFSVWAITITKCRSVMNDFIQIFAVPSMGANMCPSLVLIKVDWVIWHDFNISIVFHFCLAIHFLDFETLTCLRVRIRPNIIRRFNFQSERWTICQKHTSMTSKSKPDFSITW